MNQSGRGGGGIFCFQASPLIACNLVTGNVVDNPGDVDGAQAGGILTYGGDPLIQSNRIAGNQADYGGGLVVDYSGATVRNTVIAGNTGGAPLTLASHNQAISISRVWVNWIRWPLPQNRRS